MAAIQEKTFFGRKYKITYKFRDARIDKRKLLVVFSGDFGTKKYYDFDGPSSESVKCNVLWIRDMFDGHFTYYIRDNSGFGVASDVQNLISYFIRHLGISKKDVIIVGFSKGASAALYHGTKYDYKNIIATVPRIKLGSSNIKRPEIYQGLCNETNEKAISELDNLIPKSISDDKFLDKNIYLYSSPQDPLYENELKEHLGLFTKYKNFNFVLTESDLVRRHRDVTRYNLPNIIGIMNLLIDNIVPNFGIITNGDKDYSGLLDGSNFGEHILKLGSARIKEDFLFVSGHAFIRGIKPTDDELKNNLIFRNENHSESEYEYPLAHMTDLYLSYIYYQSKYINYDRGAFTTRRNLGIDLSDIPAGDYELSVRSLQGKHKEIAPLQTTKLKTSWAASKKYVTCLYLNGSQVRLKKYRLDQPSLSGPHYFKLLDAQVSKDTLRLKGQLAFSEASSGEGGKYYRYRMVLTNKDTRESIFVPLKRVSENVIINEGRREALYPKAAFSINRKISDFITRDGTYMISIALLAQSGYHAVSAHLELVVRENSVSLNESPSK